MLKDRNKVHCLMYRCIRKLTLEFTHCHSSVHGKYLHVRETSGIWVMFNTGCRISLFFLFFLFVCFTSYFVFSIAVLPHSPGVVYYHLLLRRETRIPGVTPFSFLIGIWDLFAHRDRNPIHPQPLRSCGPLQE